MSSNGPSSDLTLEAVADFLRRRNMGAEAERLVREAGSGQKEEDVKPTAVAAAQPSNVLSSYRSEGDPTLYADTYEDLIQFVDGRLDAHRGELSAVLYPVFVHLYLELVYNGHEREARAFAARFGPAQEGFYAADVARLAHITKRLHMSGSELMEDFRTSQFTVRLSRDSYAQLRQLRRPAAGSGPFAVETERKRTILWNVIQEHLYLDVYEGVSRSKKQVDATAGGLTGEANRQANRAKVYYGLQKEPDLTAFLQVSLSVADFDDVTAVC